MDRTAGALDGGKAITYTSGIERHDLISVALTICGNAVGFAAGHGNALDFGRCERDQGTLPSLHPIGDIENANRL